LSVLKIYLRLNKNQHDSSRERQVRKSSIRRFVLPVLEAKGHDYSGDEDINSNFPIVARRMKEEIDKYDVWQVYFTKHMMAIETWLEDREVKSEPIHMRIVDAINYLIILWSMAADQGLMPSAIDVPQQM